MPGLLISTLWMWLATVFRFDLTSGLDFLVFLRFITFSTGSDSSISSKFPSFSFSKRRACAKLFVCSLVAYSSLGSLPMGLEMTSSYFTMGSGRTMKGVLLEWRMWWGNIRFFSGEDYTSTSWLDSSDWFWKLGLGSAKSLLINQILTSSKKVPPILRIANRPQK